jgi:hypothetical protein
MSVARYTYDGTPIDAVLVVGDDDRLYVNWWNGQWQWYPMGGTALTHYVSAVTYVDEYGNLQITVYVVGGDGNLYVKFWDGNDWQWGFVGRPHVNVTVAWPSATTLHLPTDRVFVAGSDGHLYAWDATSAWVDMGGSQLANPPAALDSDTVFIVGGDGRLYGGFHSNVPYYWSPGGCFLKPFISPTLLTPPMPWADSYLVFVVGGNGRFYVMEGNYNVGFCWDWRGYDLSAYPGAPRI